MMYYTTRHLSLKVVLIACLLSISAGAGAQEIDIPFQKFVLDNGLTLIVHEDHKVPIVAVNVWYHVGSKNERPGKTGFAHLFEHLMFNGTEHYDDEYFKPFEQVGATDMNGTTSQDRTNYFQNVPVSALDTALWMESDRMGHMIGAITQEKIDEQRGVVQNEKRQGQNEPYGRVWEIMTENTYPKGHPYSWTVIGSMEDLDAASLEDVHEWFKTYYGPNNAVITIAGDIDPETALEKVKQHFGSIPAGPPLARQQTWIAKRTGTHRQKMYDRVPFARIYKEWNIPEWGSREGNLLGLAADVLASGKTSRLYKRLVYEDQIATDISAYAGLDEIGGQFVVRATARPETSLEDLEKAIDEEMARLLDKGPSNKELARVKIQYESWLVRGAERIGGFGGKSDVLARGQVFRGQPDYFKTSLEHVRQATARDVRQVARDWLSDGEYVLEVHPFPKLSVTDEDVDRSKLPQPGDPPAARFPDLQRASLANGLNVILAERHDVPLVNFQLLVDAGDAVDSSLKAGAAGLAMNLMDEGTKKRSALEISEALDMLGAELGTGAGLDTSSVSLSALKKHLDESLDIFADIALNPSFPEKEFIRLQKDQISRIKKAKSSPRQAARRVFPKLVFGGDHPYGNLESEKSVKNLTCDDMRAFHDTWFKPNNSTLIIVGDTTLDEIMPGLKKRFGRWARGSIPDKVIRAVKDSRQPVVYIIDRPGAVQSAIVGGHLAPPKSNPDETAIEIMNTILGGSFSSRINMNLREDKHWSYGARSYVISAREQRPFYAATSVQTDKTKDAMVEILKELSEIRDSRPVSAEELGRAQNRLTLRLPGSWETLSAVQSSISNIVRFGLPDDYYETYPAEVRSLTIEAVTSVAKKTLHPDNLVWVVMGDREKIENDIRAANFGPVHIIDADGKTL